MTELEYREKYPSGGITPAFALKFFSDNKWDNLCSFLGVDWWLWWAPTPPLLPFGDDGTMTAKAANSMRQLVLNGTVDPASPLCTSLRASPAFDAKIFEHIFRFIDLGTPARPYLQEADGDSNTHEEDQVPSIDNCVQAARLFNPLRNQS